MIGGFIDPGNKSLNGRERNELYRNLGRSPGDGPPVAFADAGYITGCDRVEDGRGAVAGDLDGDGDLDLVVQGFESNVVVLENDGVGAGHSLTVRLVGTRSNRGAIGARIVARVGSRTMTRHVTSTAGYLSGSSLAAHFGLGPATSVDRLTVYWPAGGTTVLEGVAADRTIVVEED